jgi:hypothetical protein
MKKISVFSNGSLWITRTNSLKVVDDKKSFFEKHDVKNFYLNLKNPNVNYTLKFSSSFKKKYFD